MIYKNEQENGTGSENGSGMISKHDRFLNIFFNVPGNFDFGIMRIFTRNSFFLRENANFAIST